MKWLQVALAVGVLLTGLVACFMGGFVWGGWVVLIGATLLVVDRFVASNEIDKTLTARLDQYRIAWIDRAGKVDSDLRRLQAKLEGGELKQLQLWSDQTTVRLDGLTNRLAVVENRTAAIRVVPSR